MPGASRRIEAERAFLCLRVPVFTLILIFFLFSLSLASAADWYVHGSTTQWGDGTSWQTPFRTIQQGIDAASDGDRVFVGQTTYVENIRFKGKNITLTGTKPSDPSVVQATIIDGNRAGFVVTFSGTEDETCVLTGFTIRNGYGEYGGGICGGSRDNRTHAAIRNNRITVNSADHGAGLALCDGVIRNNVISRNWARGYGGGAWGCQGDIENNTFSGNAAANGGALYSCYGTIRNCILWGNRAAREVSYCSVPTYSCIESWTEGGEGNIAYYPYFADAPNGDYRLMNWSPCIDAGDPASPFSEEPQPNGGRINIGAYGNTPRAATASPDSDGDALPDGWEVMSFGDLTQGPSADPDGDAISNLEEYYRGSSPTLPPDVWYVDGSVSTSGNGTSWETAFRRIQTGIEVASPGDTVIVAEGTYLENILFGGKNIILRSRSPLAPSIVSRTIIDGNYAGPAVTFLGKEDATCVLSGFTIRKGSAPNGGGICGGTSDSPTHATICNNVITQNRALEGWPHGHGAGMAYCGGVIRNNTISHNSARHGGGLFSCGGTIRNNLIVGNSAQVNGGGLLLCQGTVENNTVVRNWAEFGGGLSNCSGVIRNCIIRGNAGGNQLSHCSTPRYSCIGLWTGGGVGNTSHFAYFVDAAHGDYHLKSWSPCIDSGDPDSPFSEEPNPNGGRINMGAYGNTPEATSGSPDRDRDGLPDDWELLFFGSLAQDASGDPDADEVSNLNEYYRGLDPTNPAVIWYVDGAAGTSGYGESWETAFKTIQEGLDAASNGDTVCVALGIYVENIDFNGKDVALQSTDPLDPVVRMNTVIDGSNGGSVVSFSGNETESCVLAGFTIANGSAPYGGGIRGQGTGATIHDNIIAFNLAEWFGGGLSGCYGTIEDNTISNNYAFEGAGLAYCGGIIRRNLITANTTETSGGGLYFCTGTFEDNTISQNAALDGGGLAYCDGTIRYNEIADNVADQCGGGLYTCSGTLINNVLCGNAAGADGGGVSHFIGTVQNNTIVRNAAPYGGALSNCYAAIVNCIIWDNSGRSQIYLSDSPTYSCIQNWTGDGEGNIAFHPYFVDADNRGFHLKSWSPCIDAGDPTSPYSLEPIPNGGRVNMGAYGNTPEATAKSLDTDVDELPDGWEMYWFGHLAQDTYGDPDGDLIPNLTEYFFGWHPGVPAETVVANLTQSQWYATIQAALFAADHGDEIVAYPGVYPENVNFGGKNVTLRSTDPSDPEVIAETIIDGGQKSSAVTFSGTEDESCVLAGFTIRNGKTDCGGAICGGTNELPTRAGIEYNVITENSAVRGGGLAFCDGTVRYNTITGNSADEEGGGLYACTGTVERNSVSENTASKGGGLASCHGLIRNNVIMLNGAVENGGGLYGCDGAVENNTVVRNVASDGGGLHTCNGTLRNNIVWGNRAETQIAESSQPTYSCIEDWSGGGEGNFSYYPYFLDAPSGDYHLKIWSPCIDAGSPTSPFSEEPDPNGSRINIGAYGNTSEAASASLDIDEDGLPDQWELEFFETLLYGPDDDPEGDFISNLEEYRDGSDPSAMPGWHVDARVSVSGDGTSWDRAFKTIQEGIDAADPEDTVFVARGTYVENIRFHGKNITLSSMNPLDPDVVSETIIDGNSSGPVVTFDGTESETCLLTGFTITKGRSEYGAGICGGVLDLYTHAAIRNNVIVANTATSHGGGLAFCWGTIQNNTISGNMAGSLGGGLSECDGDILDNQILDNSAVSNGGGLCECDGTILHNVITGNLAGEFGGGLYYCDFRIDGNVIAGNSAGREGGGLSSSRGTIRNNLIYDNVASLGGGLAGCQGTVENNTVTANTADAAGGLYICSGTISNCIVWGNMAPEGPEVRDCSTPQYSCIRYGQDDGVGNTSDYPYFVAPSSDDYHLLSWSPCIDAGDPSSQFSNEPEPNGGRINMGAYGDTPEAAPASEDTDQDFLPDDWEMLHFGNLDQEYSGDPDWDGRSNYLEYRHGTDPTWNGRRYVDGSVRESGDGLSWETAFKTIQEGIDAASDWDEVIVAEGVYRENIHFQGKSISLTSTVPSNPAVVANTVIDGGRSGPVVTFFGFENENCVLSGFTIQNGSAESGGGISGNGSRAAIRNNVIKGNMASSGGGLAYCHGSIYDNAIHGNWANVNGGGLYRCNGEIYGNIVYENGAERNGGGLYVCAGAILNNVVYGNQAGNNGGGLCACNGSVENNTVFDNFAVGSGGGLCDCNGIIRNCIVWGNTAQDGFHLFGGATPTYCCIEGWHDAGDGNISYYPYFVDSRAADFHLTRWSPCIDAGDPSSDFSREPASMTGRINLGAYGNTPDAASAGWDFDGDGLPDEWENLFFGDLTQGPSDDTDGDGRTNLQEYHRGSDPTGFGTWYVDVSVAIPGDGTSWATALKTIQEGIDAAFHGDVVLVAQGTYFENIRFRGKNIALTSTDPLNQTVVATTTIDGGGTGSVVTFVGTEDETCALAGFTIRGGKAEWGGGISGGGSDNRCRATIQYNTITGNAAVLERCYGGGMAYCDGTIEKNAINGNSATYRGGGLAYCGGVIRNNIISGNSSQVGAGLAYCDALIEENAITENTADSYGGGLSWCGGTIRRNVINRNSATGGYAYGGGVDECNGVIENNLIVGNSAVVGGGGLRDCYGTIKNNMIVRNSADHGSGLTYCKGTIRNCIVWGNEGGEQLRECTAPAYCCIQHWTGGGEGNMAYFPHFGDAANGNYHLQSWSPCIDAGDPSSDFSNEPQPNGGRINMGAYGNTSEATSASADIDGDLLPDDWEVQFFGDLAQGASDDPDADGRSNIEEYQRGTNPAVLVAWYVDGSVASSGDGTSWETAFKTIQGGIEAALDGDVVLVAEGTYFENIHFRGKNIALTSTDPLNETVVANTTIDGGQNGSVVTFAATEDETCALSGFTIQNGDADSGGGIAGYGTQATIENNVIAANSARWEGGGLYDCDGVIQNNIVWENSAGTFGGALARCDGLIHNNEIAMNSAIGTGGGLNSCQGTIEGNTVRGNMAETGGGLDDCHGMIHNNTICQNSAWVYGGGLSDCDGEIWGNAIIGNSAKYGGGLAHCDGTIHNNAISGNTSQHSGGGACYCRGVLLNNLISSNAAGGLGGGMADCSNTIENNVIADNSAGESGGGLYDCNGTIRNCIIWRNSAPYLPQMHDCSNPTYSSISGWRGGGDGNISFYPHFVDPEAGDYHLQTWSPCIDAGAPSSDFSNEPQPNGGRINMGAYGNTPEATSASEDTDEDLLPDDWELLFFGNLSQGSADDPDGDGRSNLQEYRHGSDPTSFVSWYVDGSATSSGDGTSWETAFQTIQEGIDAAADGDFVLVGEGTYVENVLFRGTNIVLTSTDPLDSAVVANTVIDGGDRDSVVTFTGAEDETCVLSGFTIQNGFAADKSGGGICGGNVGGFTIATIRHNVITGNRGWDGGGVGRCDGTIWGNVVSGNSARDYGGGLAHSSGTIRNNLILDNLAGYKGGGLYDCNGAIENNTIFGNSAADGGGAFSDCDGTIRNCIIWASEGGIPISNLTIPTYSCIQGWIYGGKGNISSSPYFVDPENGDYHLTSWSLCIDAGDPSSDFSNEPQPNGGRINMGAYGNTSEAASASEDSDADLLPDDWEMLWFGDLGQSSSDDPDDDLKTNLEEHRYGTNPTFSRKWYVDASVALSGDGTSQNSAFKTIQEGIDAASDGDTVIVAEGIYSENIQFPSSYPEWETIFEEDFDTFTELYTPDDVINAGWTVLSASGSPEGMWRLWSTTGDELGTEAPDIAGMSGNYIITDSDLAPGFQMDEELITPVIDCSNWENVHLSFNKNYRSYPDDIDHLQTADVDIREYNAQTGWGQWVNLLRSDRRTVADIDSRPEQLDISAYADGRSIQVRWRYYEADFDWWFALDEVRVSGELAGSRPLARSSELGTDVKNITLRSKDPSNSSIVASTIIDGGQRRSVVTFSGNEDEATVLAGFTIRNGSAINGGGIYGTGGGNSTRATINNNVITSNLAESDGGGVAYCDGPILNNLISHNSSGDDGGGLFYCNGIIENNTIVNNSAYDFGGALAAGAAPMRNCIIWGNVAARYPQLYDEHRATYCCIQNWNEGGAGNISFSPYFVNPAAGDYHLQSWSPCIDSGDPSSNFSNEPQPNGQRINMGAYGNTPEATSASQDSDSDLLPDDWEMHFFGVLTFGASDDVDGDGRSNLQEYHYGTDPLHSAAWYVDQSVSISGDGKTWETAFKTIQEGIDAAADGDVVIVAEGTYVENVHFHGKNITLTSINPTRSDVVANTIIDGGGRGPVVTFTGTEDDVCCLAGFTITNGDASYGGGIRGGTFDVHTHVTIEHNMITNNSAVDGAGVFGCAGIIQNNTISGNAGSRGGGLYGCDGTIRNNLIFSNHATVDGGSLAYCHGTIQGNTILQNSANDDGGGLSDCNGTIVNNLIAGNGADDDGGGLYLCNGLIENNTICGNSADRGGGVYGCAGSIQNCIIWWNAASYYSQIGESSVPTFSCIQDYDGNGQGNINADPVFTDPDGRDDNIETFEDNNYRLTRTSPCIDAGNNQEWMAASFDLDGKPRITRGHSYFTVDMGAYEFPWGILMVTTTPEGDVELYWESIPGEKYGVWTCGDLVGETWMKSATVIPDTSTAVWTDSQVSFPRRFYRVEME